MVTIENLNLIDGNRYAIPDSGVCIAFKRNTNHEAYYRIEPLTSIGYKRMEEEGHNIPFGTRHGSLQDALDAYNKAVTSVLPADTDVIDLHKVE